MAIVLPIVSKFDPNGTKEAQKNFRDLSNTFSTIGKVGVVAFAAAAAGATLLGVESLKAAAASRAITQGMQNAVDNSGAFVDAAGGISAVTDQLDNHSKKLGELSGIDDEILNGIKRGWLAVPSIAATGVEGINNLAQVSADIAAGTGKDIESIALMFTKTAGDTETALSKMTRAGIYLSDSQTEMYNSLVASGDEMGAQAFLVDTLGERYKGAAEAGADPFARLQVILGNVAEDIGTFLLPAMDEFVSKIQEYIASHGPQLQEAMTKVSDAVLWLVDAFAAFSAWVDENPELFNAIVIVLGSIAAALAVATVAMWALNVAAYANPIVLIIMAIIVAVGLLVAAIVLIWQNWDTITKAMATAWEGLTYNLSSWWTGVQNTVIDGINTMISGLNGFLDVLNAVTGTSFHVDMIGKVSGPVQPMSQRSGEGMSGGRGVKLAAGGIIPAMPGGLNATIAEAGPEAVIPLDRLDRMMGGGGSGNSITINVNAGMGADGAAIGEQIVTAIRKYERSSGKVFAAA